jgi:hypothetical protein
LPKVFFAKKIFHHNSPFLGGSKKIYWAAEGEAQIEGDMALVLNNDQNKMVILI